MVISLLALLTIAGCATRDGVLNSGEQGSGYILIREKNNLDAMVFLDHQPVGSSSSGSKIGPVGTGRHVVHLRRAKHRARPDSIEFILTDAGIELMFQLDQAPFGGLSLSTVPPGARVMINQLYRGRTPLDGLSRLPIEGLPVGDYVLDFQHGNYGGRKNVSLKSGATVSLNQSLGLARFILVEHFSNTSCEGCPEVSGFLDSLIALDSTGTIVSIEYHASFPSGNDPMYLAAKNDNSHLLDFYNPDFLPAIYVNGGFVDWGADFTRVGPAVLPLLQQTSPGACNLVIHQTGRASGHVTVEAAAEALDGLTLKIALVQEEVAFDVPPGSNKQKVFHHIFRGAFPDAGGSPVSLAAGASATTPFNFNLFPFGNGAFHIVAWILNTKTKTVIQTNTQRLKELL